MTEPLVYLSGNLLPASQAHIAIFDAGVVLGATVTEMTRTFNLQPFRLEQHIERLQRSLRYTRMDTGLTSAEFLRISHEIIEHNSRLLPPGGELGMVHFVTAGEYPTYAGMAGRAARTSPTVCIHTFPMPFELWVKKFRLGAHLVTPAVRHVPPQCYDPKMKYRSRMHYYLADKEAQLVDPEAAALLLDLQGNITETSGANFLIVERGTIVSPTTVNTLPGISRGMVIELAGKLGIPFVERDLQVYNVINADEAFTTSTPYCVLPVTRINGLPIADGRPGPIFRRLIEAWGQAVGIDIERQMIEGAQARETLLAAAK
jgi:branched-subunit amino acid aminotransferase/4-amino-4-deoxychorismate lyase